MKNSKLYFIVFCFLAITFSCFGKSTEFFKIKSVKFYSKPQRKGISLYRKTDESGKHDVNSFLPFLKVTVSTQATTKASKVYAKAYYYDKSRKLIYKTTTPYPVLRGAKQPYPMPVFFQERKNEVLYFAVPTKVLNRNKWQAVVVFGDKHSVAALAYPHKSKTISSFDFPEQNLVKNHGKVEREKVTYPVIEFVIKTHNSRQPQITLFMRPPVGITNLSDAKGVLAMCLLANNVGEIKRRLQKLEAQDDVGKILRFANKHKLVILCWGSRSLWNPKASWDEQSKHTNKQMDRDFDDVAKAWGKGVDTLAVKYGMPKGNFLLWGRSGSAQYAARLALRKPEYFLAIHIHVPSSFDKPTKKANRVLWCLTTGENEAGYQRSLRFVAACRKLGYPIIYKAIIGLGHSGHPVADQLGLDFFEYALTMRAKKRIFEDAIKDSRSPFRKEWEKNSNRPWPRFFNRPAFVADIVNQEIFPFKKPFKKANIVPENFRIMLPTNKLAQSWNR